MHIQSGEICCERIPYVEGISDAVSRILKPIGIKTILTVSKRKWSVLAKCKEKRDVKDQMGVIFLLSCTDCNLKYIGETGRTARTRAKEHLADFQKCHPEKSATDEHE